MSDKAMIRKCHREDFEAIYSIINEAAFAYEGVIPDECWKNPYMSKEDLSREASFLTNAGKTLICQKRT